MTQADIIKSSNQRMSDIKAKITGTHKRHDAIRIGLLQARHRAYQDKFDHDMLTEYLGRKLKSDEGFILDYTTYGNLFERHPSDLDVADLQHKLQVHNISLAPLYKKNEKGEAIALFIIFHRHPYLALEFADELRSIITGKPNNNVHSEFIKAALKVSEELIKMSGEKGGTLYKQDVYDAVQLLSGNEVYLISISYCMMHRIDPKQLDDLLSSSGFKVSVLKHDRPPIETNEHYKFYDNLIGLAVSRTDDGIKLAHDNLNTLFRVCEAADAGIPKAAEDTLGLNIVQ